MTQDMSSKMMVVGVSGAWGQFLGYIFGCYGEIKNYTHRFDLRRGHGGNSQCKDRQLFDTNQAFPQGINKR